jgi:hypothetical protein
MFDDGPMSMWTGATYTSLDAAFCVQGQGKRGSEQERIYLFVIED